MRNALAIVLFRNVEKCNFVQLKDFNLSLYLDTIVPLLSFQTKIMSR